MPNLRLTHGGRRAVEPSEAIEVVREFQAWRRGGDQPMPYPQTTGEAIDALCYHAERMEAELAVWKHDVKLLEAELQKFDQAAIEWWCEYQELKAKAGEDRAEIEQIKATLANPHAVHVNMLRGTIQWTPANLRHLLGET